MRLFDNMRNINRVREDGKFTWKESIVRIIIDIIRVGGVLVRVCNVDVDKTHEKFALGSAILLER